MLSVNGTIAHDIEAHNLNAHKTSAARQELTTRKLQKKAYKIISNKEADVRWPHPN